MSFFISCQKPELRQACEALIGRFDFCYSESILPRLCLREEGLVLLDNTGQSIHLNWNDAKWKQRALGALGHEPLIKVTQASQGVRILDLTAGWGKDGLMMANAGSELVMLEKNPYMAALLFKAHQGLDDEDLKSKIRILWCDAHHYLNQLEKEGFPDVIYIDPMHPTREKSALVKKQLQVLQQLVAPNDDVGELIALAQMHCKKKVVVKWPQKQKPTIKPNHSIQGKTIRYDVYLPSNADILIP